MATNDTGGVKRKVLNTEYTKLVKQLDIIEKNLNAMYKNLENLNKAWHGGTRAYNVYTNMAANYKNNVAKTKVLEELMTNLNKYRKALNAQADYNKSAGGSSSSSSWNLVN